MDNETKILELLEEIKNTLAPDPETRLNTLLIKATHGLTPMENGEIVEMFDLLNNAEENTTDPRRVIAILLYRRVVEHSSFCH